jgi:site-specific DNA recombinase
MRQADKHPTRPLRAAIYTRVSSAKQGEEGTSLETQEQACRAYAEARGYEVAVVYRETHTGADLFERAQLTRLRDAIRGGDIDVVIVYALDRLSRNQAHLGFIYTESDRAGVAIELVSEDLDATPEGQLLQAVRGYIAETERLRITERTRRGIRARVEEGRPITGPKAPYGYRWRDEHKSGYDFDPVTAPIARRIYDRVLAGDSLRSIAMALTAEGVPTPTGRGKRWEVVTLHSVLKNPIYTGQVYAYRHQTLPRTGRQSRTVVKRPLEEQVRLPDGTAPALVTQVEFDAVQQRLACNRATAPRNNANPEATLLRCGIGRCGYCGRPLSITSRKGRGHYYRCHPNNSDRQACPSFGILASILDPLVWNHVRDFMLTDEVLERAVANHTGGAHFAGEIAALDRRLAEIGRQRQNLSRAIASMDNDEAAEPLVADLGRLADERRSLSARRDALASQAAGADVDRERLKGLREWRTRVAANLDRLTYDQKRMVLEALGVVVSVYREDHEPRIEIVMAPLGGESTGEHIVFGNTTRSSTATRR